MKNIVYLFIVSFVITILFKKRRKEAMRYDFDPTDETYIRSQFDVIKNSYSDDVLRQVEKIYRLETSHFKSGQYKASLSAGMVYSIDNKILPWKLSGYDVVGFSKAFEVGGKSYRYVAFGSLSEGFRYLADYIVRHGGNGLRWFSTNEDAQKDYANLLAGIKTRFI